MTETMSSHLTPFGHLAEGNPYDAYLPPHPDDPGGFVHPETPS